MALDSNFKHLDIREALAGTHMKGRNITFLDDFSRDEILSLYQAAEMLEPFMRTGTDLLRGKVLYTLFFQPSTRTRCSHENAMHRLGGSVITEADPTHNSSVAKNESLADSLRVTSEYADVIGTYLYRYGLVGGNFSYGTAVGFMIALINFGMVYLANMVSRKVADYSLW